MTIKAYSVTDFQDVICCHTDCGSCPHWWEEFGDGQCTMLQCFISGFVTSEDLYGKEERKLMLCGKKPIAVKEEEDE